MSTERVDEALARFDQLERRVDYAEGRADAMRSPKATKPSLVRRNRRAGRVGRDRR